MKFFEELKNKITDILPSNNLDFLEIGDIIWAKRYSTEKERITIETGHQQGPFIIIHKENKKVYGLYCTSSTRKDTNKFHYLILDKNQYKLKLFKTTYIQTTTDREIKYSQYIRKIGHLTDKDLNHLFKIIYIMKIHEPQNLSLHIEEKDLCYNIEIGDIIKKKQSTYLVYMIITIYIILMKPKILKVMYHIMAKNLALT